MRRAAAVLVAALAYLGLATGPAWAIAPTTTYSFWTSPTTTNNPGSNWNAVGQYIIPANEPTPTAGQLAPGWFLAYQFNVGAYAGGTPRSAYIGIQKDVNGERAIFSLWGAAGAWCSAVPGATCGTFTNEGTGMTVRIPYEQNPNESLFVYATKDYQNPNLWHGYVQRNGVSSHIGSLLSSDPAGATYIKSSNNLPPGSTAGSASFTEWIGQQSPPPAACTSLPDVAAWYSFPYHYPVAGYQSLYERATGGSPFVAGDCSASVVTGYPQWHYHVNGS